MIFLLIAKNIFHKSDLFTLLLMVNYFGVVLSRLDCLLPFSGIGGIVPLWWGAAY